MDIGRNLLYNKNTVRSGDFLEEPPGSGKETMHYRKNKNHKETSGTGRRNMHGVMCVAVLLVGIVLCGCTRKEQLILDIGSGGGGMQDEESGLCQDTGNDYKSPDGGQSVEVQPSRLDTDTQGLAGTADVTRQPGEAMSGQPDGAGLETSREAGGAQGQPYQDDTNGAPQKICVHVCGAVEHPGVYELPAGSRVHEAVKKAGGFAGDADESYVNQAQILSDGVKLVIPTVGQAQDMVSEGESMTAGIVGGDAMEVQAQTAQGGASGNGQTATDDRININTASEADLCSIPGIGATRAAAVVAYRQEHGVFASVEDIMNVSGIKEWTYAKIKDRIKVD